MNCIIKFQIGPVQDFIATARSTRDLWSASYLLSWLVAAGIRSLPEDAQLIFPDRSTQPLLRKPSDPTEEGILIPNLPNLFIAEVSGDAASVADRVKEAIEKEWKDIAAAVWSGRSRFRLPDDAEARFDAQIARHLSISWQATPLGGDYAAAYRHNGWHLDAIRQTRAFIAWDPASGSKEKDSLTGKEEALIGGTSFQEACAEQGGEYASLFSKHSDHLGAVSVIKRCWHIAYLRGMKGMKTGSREFTIRSIPAIAAREEELDDDRAAGESPDGEKYIAAIAFDGDSIGKWVNGDDLADISRLREHHGAFSGALSSFAMAVRGIVEPQGQDKPLGQLIYAGGDDVVCLVPADAALDVAAKLRTAFREATSAIQEKSGNTPDASAGIAIAHIHAPLQDLIRAAQAAEKRAKKKIGRPAFSITLMKRSGEISHWGSKWSAGGLELYQCISGFLADGRLTSRFPHRVCQLLDPYLISRSPLAEKASGMQDAADFDAVDIIAREFAFAVTRQSGAGLRAADKVELEEKLRTYLSNLLQEPQTLLTSITGLCTAVAFAHRNRERDTSSTASQQPASV